MERSTLVVCADHADLAVPTNSYFVLGDNSTNSFDRRFWGCIPAGDIVGRLAFRF